MAKPRKEQLHGANLQLWNFKGANDFSAFAPVGVLSNDAWVCNAAANVSLDSGLVIIRPGDMVLALIDNPGNLTHDNIIAGKWKIIKNITDDEVSWLENQLYDPPSATITGGTTLEKYHSLTAYSATLNWTTTAGTNAITTREFQKREGAGSWTKVKDLTGNSGSESVNVTINTDTQFRVLVSSKVGEAIYSSTTQVVFQYKTGYRLDVASPTINSAWMKAGTMGFDTDAYRSFTLNAAAGEHLYYYVPKALVSSPYISPPYFYVGGFEGGFEIANSAADYEFGDGTTGEYVVYKSTQAGLGNTTVTVQST